MIPLLATVIGVALIAGYVLIVALGRNPEGYLTFTAGPVVSAIVGALLSRQAASNSADASASVQRSDRNASENSAAIRVAFDRAALQADRNAARDRHPAGTKRNASDDDGNNGS